jgi:putative hemolysin
MNSVSQAMLPGVLPKGVPAFVPRVLGFEEVDRTYQALRRGDPAKPLLERLLQFMEVTYKVSPEDLKHVPRTGPVVIVANHPFGILEAAVLVTAIQQIRPDVRVLGNELLRSIPEVRDLLIPVDILSGARGANAAGLRRAIRSVREGGVLIVFPAGAVSHFQWREQKSVDPPWSASVARMISLMGDAVVVVPVYVPGSNSFLFQAAGMLHASLRTALLARELLNKRRSSVELRIGRGIAPGRLAQLGSDEARIEYMRWRTYMLANRNPFKPETRMVRRRGKHEIEAVVDSVPASAMAREVAELAVVERSGELEVYLAGAARIPNVLREIGRLREITFREAGEGTGRCIDLDEFDETYLHLFVWHAAKHEVVGAYRLQATDAARSLYTRTLFQFDAQFLAAMGPAVELGRSFIRAEYQKGFAPLLLLWKGIGKFVAANPCCKTLFGPVSISNQYQAVSRELMIAFLEAHAGISDWVGMVRPRNAPEYTPAAVPCSDVEELSDVIGDIEPGRAGIPVLLRQYLKLGGKLLGFNVDAEFSDVLDGLIVVDLTKTQPKLLERYLGKSEAAAFLKFQKETIHEA